MAFRVPMASLSNCLLRINWSPLFSLFKFPDNPL